ncbi:MAG: twin-arginine translocation signal domain-containing protein [Desulfobacterales bacterium]|jgi:hypothetical protein
MSLGVDNPISRRSFLKWTGAATAASIAGAKAPVLHALVPEKEARASGGGPAGTRPWIMPQSNSPRY